MSTGAGRTTKVNIMVANVVAHQVSMNEFYRFDHYDMMVLTSKIPTF